MQVVGQPVMKKDAMALVTGKPVFTQDVAPADCLVVKVLRSPHANANILSIKTDAAKKVPGIEAVYTWEDVPTQRFTMAGQTYPEPSPYDRQILDQHVRYVGDPVAIVAGENEECVDKALKCSTKFYRPFWIFTKPKIMRFWFTRKKTGKHYVRWEQIISAIWWQQEPVVTGMWKLFSKTVK